MHLEGKICLNLKYTEPRGEIKINQAYLVYYLSTSLVASPAVTPVWAGSLQAWLLGVYHGLNVRAAAGKRTLNAFIIYQLSNLTVADIKLLWLEIIDSFKF